LFKFQAKGKVLHWHCLDSMGIYPGWCQST